MKVISFKVETVKLYWMGRLSSSMIAQRLKALKVSANSKRVCMLNGDTSLDMSWAHTDRVHITISAKLSTDKSTFAETFNGKTSSYHIFSRNSFSTASENYCESFTELVWMGLVTKRLAATYFVLWGVFIIMFNWWDLGVVDWCRLVSR